MSTIEQPGSDRAAPLAGDDLQMARSAALAESGLGPTPDFVMDRLATRIRRRLGASMAAVSLFRGVDQVFPGAAGLPEPLSSTRSAPLALSFCRHVQDIGRPVAIADVRIDPLTRNDVTRDDATARAYLGVPLTDMVGTIVGTVSVADVDPHPWTDEQVAELVELAELCSTELRLRLALVDAEHERRRRDEIEAAMRAGFGRVRTLLDASQAFTETSSVEDVQSRVNELVRSELQPTYVALVLTGPSGRRRLQGPGDPTGIANDWQDREPDLDMPSTAAIRERRIVHHRDRDEFDAVYPPSSSRLLRALGLDATVAAPIIDTDGVVGALVLGWDHPRDLMAAELLTITTIAGYAGQALHRARHLQHRVSVAHRMQQAMLTTLPAVRGLELAARYRPADDREDIGGDWYDIVPIAEHHPHASSHDAGFVDGQVLAASVGDIIGHTLDAAIDMGQVRSMLRQSAWDHPAGPPSAIMTAFERANTGTCLHATGTAVLAHLRRRSSGCWSMTWVNAGHPPPLLLGPDGSVRLLTGHGPLFGFPSVDPGPRTDSQIDLPGGSTLIMHTDGLIEHRHRDLDSGTDALLALLPELRGLDLGPLVDALVASLASDAEIDDDVAVLALRVP